MAGSRDRRRPDDTGWLRWLVLAALAVVTLALVGLALFRDAQLSAATDPRPAWAPQAVELAADVQVEAMPRPALRDGAHAVLLVTTAS